MAKYDDYTYPNSTVLRNKFGLQDPIQAHTMETRLAYQRVAELAQHPVQGNYDLKHLLEINGRTLQDMYDWAGKLRDAPTQTAVVGLPHCLPENLQQEADRIFGDLRRDDLLQGKSDAEFTDRLAYHWGELTALHPSLDGNTRSQRVFMDQLTRSTGRSIDWAAVNQNIEAFKYGRLYAHARADHGPLRDQLAKVIRPGVRETGGIELAGPAVDPVVAKAALSGLPSPGSPASGTTSVATKHDAAKDGPRGYEKG
ncbi:Fic/DOC family protein [Kribbella sp. NPDC048928]|uniref:Fic/DOC family protein n=1 Tax=Kribbella sp. NPDC048928 TaxID=3364111 RepID=UPI00371B3A08